MLLTKKVKLILWLVNLGTGPGLNFVCQLDSGLDMTVLQTEKLYLPIIGSPNFHLQSAVYSRKEKRLGVPMFMGLNIFITLTTSAFTIVRGEKSLLVQDVFFQ